MRSDVAGPLAQSPPDRLPSLWPREHGAYVQLAYPVLCAWLVGEPTVASVLLGLGAFVAFLAHEPTLLVIGRRGARKREAVRGRVERRLLLLGTLAAALGGVALGLAPPLAQWLAGVPLGIGTVVAALMFAGRERSLPGELLVAVTLASVSLPVAVSAAVPLDDALILFGAWAVCFALATVAARGVLFQKKDGGRMLRGAMIASLLVAPIAVAMAAANIVAPALALSPLPFCLAAVFLALRPPSPRRMHALGFALMGACTVTLALLVLGIG